MLNHKFHHVRDIRDERKELSVTANRTSEPFVKLGDMVNVRVDTEAGWNDSTKLWIKFEWSKDGIDFVEIGTFAIIDEHHGVLSPKYGDYLRYTLIVEGEDQCLDIVLRF